MTVTIAAATAQPRRCKPSCLCRLWTNDEEVVPYRGDDSPADEELIEAWKANDCVVCIGWWMGRVLVDERYRRVVRSVARDYPEADLEGATQSILMAIYQGRPAMTRPLGYFAQSLWNAAEKDVGVHRQRRLWYVDPVDQDVAPAEEEPLTPELYEHLEACCEKLAEKSRSLVRAIYWEKTPPEAVAAAQGIKPQSLTRKLHRIRESLRDCLENLGA